MDSLKTVFGIDVSSRKSNVCIMINGQNIKSRKSIPETDRILAGK